MRIIFLLQRLWPSKPSPPLFYIQFKIPHLQTDFWGINLTTQNQAFQNVHKRDWIYLYAINKVILKSIRRGKWFLVGDTTYCLPCLSNLFLTIFSLVKSSSFLLAVVHAHLMHKADYERCSELREERAALFSQSALGSVLTEATVRDSNQGTSHFFLCQPATPQNVTLKKKKKLSCQNKSITQKTIHLWDLNSHV